MSVSVSRELVEVMEARLVAPVKLVQPVPWLPITQEGWHESRPCPFVCMYMCVRVCDVRPVRMHMDLDSNMRMVGKRYPYYAKYTVSFVHVRMGNLLSRKYFHSM